jgi:hypothetical protein
MSFDKWADQKILWRVIKRKQTNRKKQQINKTSMTLGNPLYIPEILLLHVAPYLSTLDLVSLKKCEKHFNAFFSQDMLFSHLKKWDCKRNQKAVYHYYIRHWNYPKLQAFFTTPSLNKSLTQYDRNEGVKMFCNANNIPNCLKKIQWMKEYGCIDLSHGKNLLLRHAIKGDEFELVDYLLSNGADPLLFNAYALEWLTLHGTEEMITLVLQEGIEDEVEKTLSIAVVKDRAFPFQILYRKFPFLYDRSIRHHVFYRAIECQSFHILERFLLVLDQGFCIGIPYPMPMPAVDVAQALTTVVQVDNNRMVKMFMRYIMMRCQDIGPRGNHFLNVFEAVREAFFWAVFKQRWALKSLLLRFLEELAEIGFAYDLLVRREGLLDGQRDLAPPIDYLFLLCTLVHKPGKNNEPFILFRELHIEFPFANCLLAAEREFLLWFCLHQGQLRFFELCIQPLRGNCRTVSQPFRVPVSIECVYSEFLAMDMRPQYNSSAILHFKDSETCKQHRQQQQQPPRFVKTRTVHYEGFRTAVHDMIKAVPDALHGNLWAMWKNFLVFLEWKIEGSCKFKELEKKLPNVIDWEFCDGNNDLLL